MSSNGRGESCGVTRYQWPSIQPLHTLPSTSVPAAVASRARTKSIPGVATGGRYAATPIARLANPTPPATSPTRVARRGRSARTSRR